MDDLRGTYPHARSVVSRLPESVHAVPHSAIARHRLVPADWGLAVAAAAAMVAADRWARDGELTGNEQRVFEVVNECPDGLRYGWWGPMQFGNALVWAIGPVVVLWRTGRWRPAVASFVGPFAGWLGAKQVKRVIKRGRPEFFLADAVRFREAAPTGFGYISGHAAVAFAFATVLRPYLPRRWRLPLYGLAALTATGRMYFGAHLPADVLGGAGFGVICGLAANAVAGVDGEPGRN
jgi:glycosyltransferase 2 family protein